MFEYVKGDIQLENETYSRSHAEAAKCSRALLIGDTTFPILHCQQWM